MSTQMNSEVKDDEKRAILVDPVSLEGATNSDNKSPSLIKRILALFKEVRLGTDLTQLQLQVPAVFNMPKSQLQCYGEAVYACRGDLMERCNKANTPLDRFIAVVAWTISTTRPVIFAVAPYNPILGETHHVSRGTLNVLLEQVSHHPPVSALHATDEKENIDLSWCIYPIAKFHGTAQNVSRDLYFVSVGFNKLIQLFQFGLGTSPRLEAELTGKRQLKLLNHGETYLMNSPKYLFRVLRPGVDWVGNVKISCQETGFEAELCYNTSSFLGRGGNHSIKGKIYQSCSSGVLYELDGHWNSVVTMKDINNKIEKIIYNAKEIISELKSPVLKDSQGLWSTESAVVWSEVSRGILTKNWDKAIDAKKAIEEKQRELARERKSKGENWFPKYFSVSYDKIANRYDCLPIQECVPPAPIIFTP